MRTLALITLIAACAACAAQEYGDAAASYGTAQAWAANSSNPSWLGEAYSIDSQNPVTPAWYGDTEDDGIAVPGTWDSWSSTNVIHIHVNGDGGYLLMWVDANDNGTWEANEMYEFMPDYWLPAGIYTFDNVKIHATQDFTRNAQNKVAVRVMIQNTFGLPPQRTPNASVWWGEVEDHLIDVQPARLAVQNEILREATETETFVANLNTVNGTGPYTWAQVSGALPQGMGLAQQGDAYVLSGTPSAGTAAEYQFTVEVTDSTSAVAQRTFTLEVTHAPFALPFIETFSNNHYWNLGSNWAITPATGFVGSGTSGMGYPATEPAEDFTPGNSDNMMLLSSPNAEEPDLKPRAEYVMSPKINCSGVSEVQLRFRRWYSVFVHPVAKYGNDDINVSITSDGVNWDKVWVPPYEPLTAGLSAPDLAGDIEWSLITADISQWAANKAWIRLRFQIGEYSNTNMFGIGLCGWGIDDIEVREMPFGSGTGSMLAAYDMELISPAQWQNPNTGAWEPLLYPQFTHTWEVKVDNNTANAVTINSVEGTSLLEVFVTNSPDFAPASADCWHDWGNWSLPQPVVVPAGATNFVVSGEFHYVDMPANYWLGQGFHGRVYLRGVQAGTNAEVELVAQDTYLGNNTPLPGVYVYETQVGTTQILNGEPAVSTNRDFGSVLVGGSSNWQNIIIENATSSSMVIGTPMLGGGDPGEFDLTLPSPTSTSPGFNNTIPANGWVWFAVKYRPTMTGPRSATVEFTHTAPNTGTPFAFELAGFGAANAPIIVVRETNATGPTIPNGGAPSGIRDFGPVDIGGGAAGARTIHIENVGTQPLTLGTPGLAGANAADFALSATGALGTLAPGASATFTFDFDPATVGVKNAWIEIAHNDTGTATPYVINLTGLGAITAPTMTVYEGGSQGAAIPAGAAAANARVFGSIAVNAGSSSPVRVYIRNDGWNDLVLPAAPSFASGNTGDFVLDTSALSLTVPYQTTTWFEVSFDPTSKGFKSAWISFGHNDAGVMNPFQFEVLGFGDDPNGVIITSAMLTGARIGDSYTAQLGAAQGTAPYAWAATGGNLPAGLSVQTDGQVTGTPTGMHGVFQFDVEVTDATGGTESRTITLTVSPPTGFIGKGGGSSEGDGGCAAMGAADFGLLALITLLGITAARRRRMN